MKPAIREFSKDAPCSKLDLWTCFAGPSGFKSVQVDVAYSIIGKNAPRVAERNGYVKRVNTATGDYLQLTAAGERWLTQGIQAYHKNHPTETIPYLPGTTRGRRRTRAG